VGRSLRQLQLDFKQQITLGLEKASTDSICRQNIIQWDFDKLPEQVSIERGKVIIKAWPCLRDRGDWVDIELSDNPLTAANLSAQGQLRLALLAGREQVKYLTKNLLRGSDLVLKAAVVADRSSIVAAIVSASFQQAMFSEGQVIRDRTNFEKCFEYGLSAVVGIAQQYADTLESLLPTLHQCRKQLGCMGLAAVYAKSDIESQVQRLFLPCTLSGISLERITQYPRFVRAIQIRLDKLPMQVAKDRQYIGELQAFLAPLQEQQQYRDRLSRDLVNALDDFVWAVEEYRVSLFAQQLKTRMPISAKRLQKHWSQLREQLRRFL